MDREVGLRIRSRRQAVGLSQQQMAELIGTTYQQVHKYEKGTNRVSAGQLFAIALVLGTDVAFFFGLSRTFAAPFGFFFLGLSPGLMLPPARGGAADQSKRGHTSGV